MKKILLIAMAAVLMTACGSDNPATTPTEPKPGEPTNPIPESEWRGDWNDPVDTQHYKPEYGGHYNPLFGKWLLTRLNGKAVTDFLVYDFGDYGKWYYADRMPEPGKAPQYKKLDDRIKINDTAIRNSKGVIFNYQVATDRKSMTLYDGTSYMSFTEYDNNGVWYWRGDWNNPKDAGYRPEYKGRYNPIVGTWKLISVGGVNVSPRYYKYNDDFTMEELYTAKSKRSYKINDTGVWESSYPSVQSSYYSYKIERNTLYYNVEPYSEYDAAILTRYY